MAFTTDERDRLKAAIARGVRTVTLNGETVQYNSLSDMKKALRMIEAELNGGETGAVTVYPKTTRGLS